MTTWPLPGLRLTSTAAWSPQSGGLLRGTGRHSAPPDSAAAATALRLAVHADPAFGLAVADLDAITGTASQGPGHQQMNWERHHIEVVRAAATGNARRAADLLREHLASVGCDPLAFRIAAMLRQPAGKNDDFENLASHLPGCHATPWPCPP